MSLLDDIKKMEEAALSGNSIKNEPTEGTPSTIADDKNQILFRAVKDSNSSTVIAIGLDENQAGAKYNDNEGVWCDFTFSQMPEITLTKDSQLLVNDFNQWLQSNSPYNDYLELSEYNFKMFRILNDKIVMKTETQIKTMIDEAKAIISEKYKDYKINEDISIIEPPIIERPILVEEKKPISLFDAMKPVE